MIRYWFLKLADAIDDACSLAPKTFGAVGLTAEDRDIKRTLTVLANILRRVAQEP